MHNAADSKPRTSRRKPVPIDLGLQGGGAHGAFTWGVLDRLLDEPWLQFEGISGTSAGAMNAAVMASGYVHGGADGAKAALATFWKSMSDAARFSPIQRGPLEMLTGKWTLEHSPMYLATEMLSRIFSPYELNPLGTHPLRGILAETVDFACLADSPIKLFITEPLTPVMARESPRSRSTASTTGTAASSATRRSRRWYASAAAATRSSSRSTRSSATACRKRRATS